MFKKNTSLPFAWLLFAAGAISFGCGAPKQSNNGNVYRATVRSNRPPRPRPQDTIMVGGVEKIALTGRSEAGTIAALQGVWVLDVMNDTALAASGVHSDKVPGMANSMKHDTTIKSELKNGGIRSTTNITSSGMVSPVPAITPAQGNAYHVPGPPSLSFFGANDTFTGFTGCNKMGGRFTLTGSKNISFRNAAPSTRMACIGDHNENVFLETLQKVNAFKRSGEQLLLLQGEKVLLRFSKR